MKKILLMGRGNLFCSIVKFLSENKGLEAIAVVQYEQKKDVTRHPFLEVGQLQVFDRIYLVPETIDDGVFLTAYFSEIFIGSLFVVTDNFRSNLLYKKMGADYVIISKPKCKSFSWFPFEKRGKQGGDLISTRQGIL